MVFRTVFTPFRRVPYANMRFGNSKQALGSGFLLHADLEVKVQYIPTFPNLD